MDDIRAVVDAVGADRATLAGMVEGGQTCALFAATYPERTEALVLANTPARAVKAEDSRTEFARTTGVRSCVRDRGRAGSCGRRQWRVEHCRFSLPSGHPL
jgi:pimeloyl-ACP methyl ester carboxylesterase